MLGSCIMTLSLIAFAFIYGFEFMYLTMGVAFGIGNGMMQLTISTAFVPYFEKRKALSLGLTSAGSGLGMVLMPIILRYLLDNYPFSMAMLLYAGVCMQTLVVASLLRPFSLYEKWAKPRQKFFAQLEVAVLEDDQHKKVSNDSQGCFRERSYSMGTAEQLLKPDNPNSTFLSTPNLFDKPQVKSDTQQLSSLQIIARSMQDFDGLGLISNDENSNEDVEQNEESKTNNNPEFNWRLVYNPWCITLGVALLVYSSGITLTLQCIPPLGKQIGLSKELVSIMLSVTGGVEMIMKIFNGWFADKKFVSAPTQIGLCMMFSGVTALLCAALSSLAGIVMMLIGVSLTGTSVFSLLPVTCSELFGKEQVRSATALNFVYMGVAIIVGTFSAGGIYESTKGWEYVYYFVSGCCLLGSVLMFLITFVTRRKRKQKQ